MIEYSKKFKEFNMKKIIIIFAVLLFVSNITLANNWQQVDDNHYIDTDSIEYYVDSYGKKDYNKYSFWVQNINNDDKTWKETENSLKKLGEKRKPAYTNNRVLIDCRQKTITIKAFATYAEDGKVIDSYEIKDLHLDWKSIVPNSIGEGYYNNTCKANRIKRGISKFVFGS